MTVVLAGNFRNILAIGLVIGFMTSTSCGKIHYPDYYVLNIPAPAPANRIHGPVAGSLAVREFRAPVFLREGAIVYRPSPEQIDFYHFYRWAEDPRRAVTDLMVQHLQAGGFFRSVDLYDGRGSADLVLSGTLEHLEELDHDGKVSVQVTISARIVSAKTGDVVWQGMSSKIATLDKRTIAGIVEEMSRQMGSAVESLVLSIRDRLPAPAAPETAITK
jgi:ABC-type uncharacterized transport system auxiliary subunit